MTGITLKLNNPKDFEATHKYSQYSIYTRIQCEFQLPTQILPKLEKYYILHWDGKYFRNQIAANVGILVHDGFEYIPIYHKGKQCDIYRARTVALSFRKLAEQKFGYVIIRELIPAYKPTHAE